MHSLGRPDGIEQVYQRALTAMPKRTTSPGELVGTWQLESYVRMDDEDRTSEGPLGPTPQGLLIYGADCQMAVSMMRTDQEPARDDSPVTRFMGYAGTWWLAGKQVIHEVAVSSHSHLVGTRQVRDLVLNGDLLTLSGTALVSAGPPQRRVLTWRRTDGGKL